MKVFTKTVTLTKAQIDALFATGSPAPLNLIPAPGAGKSIMLVSASIFKTAGGAATAGTAEMNLSFGSASTPVMEFTNVDAAAGFLGNAAQGRVQPAIAISNAVDSNNLPLNISSSAAIVCAADTVAKIVINFMIVDM